MQTGYKIVYAFTGQTVLDIAIQEYGNANALLKVASENNVALDYVFTPEDQIIIDTNYKASVESFSETKLIRKTKDGEVAINNQNIWDIVLQEFGTIEAVFAFMKANNINGLDTKLSVNKRYKLPDNVEKQKNINDYYLKNKIKITTGNLPSGYELREDGGFELREDGGKMLLEV